MKRKFVSRSNHFSTSYAYMAQECCPAAGITFSKKWWRARGIKKPQICTASKNLNPGRLGAWIMSEFSNKKTTCHHLPQPTSQLAVQTIYAHLTSELEKFAPQSFQPQRKAGVAVPNIPRRTETICSCPRKCTIACGRPPACHKGWYGKVIQTVLMLGVERVFAGRLAR